jgi:acid phosphatase type 7
MRAPFRLALIMVVSLNAAAEAATTYTLAAPKVADPLVFVAYGDMRFTAGTETSASSPTVRAALVARIASENPAAIFINGDIPWHGIAADYEVFRRETRLWREQHVHVYPALGNHEFSACIEPSCLDRWWGTFPELRSRRWYSVAIGVKLVGISLDSDTSLLPGSEQRIWLEDQMASLAAGVRIVLLVMHHPPVEDVQTTKAAHHNPRPNEESLGDYLQALAAHSKVRFVVSAGHIHNYERFERGRVVYLVSGGGGATPSEVERTPADLYQNTDFPNYHYVRFELRGQTLKGEMIRLNDFAAAAPGQWQTRDRFEVSLQP